MPSETILVADDDGAIRTVLNQALGRAGFDVRSTGNASTLWRWVSQGEGDLVISDVVMPDENAFDLIPRIVSGSEWSEVSRGLEQRIRAHLPGEIMSGGDRRRVSRRRRCAAGTRVSRLARKAHL